MKNIITNTIINLDGTTSVESFEIDVDVPNEVTNFQARAILLSIGKFDLVDTAIKEKGGIALQAWEYANTIVRNGPLTNSLATELGFSQEEIDELFYQASFIEA